jgi:hypothetical protein
VGVEEGAEGLAGAVEAGFDEGFGDGEEGGGLLGGQFFDVAEEEDVTEIGGEFVDG